MNCSFDSGAFELTNEESFLSFTEMEPLDVSDILTSSFQATIPKPTSYRFKQPEQDLISTANEHFYKMMESHSAIYSAFTFLTRKGLCYVPKNVLEPLSIKTTKTSVLLLQEQRILLFINDRKEADRKTIVKEILQEPHLSDSWYERLSKMVQ